MKTWACALALLGSVAFCCAAIPTEAGADSGLDAAFLQSWLHLDAAAADKLANDGAAVAATRRDLLASAAAAGTFGAAALPGAYPAPPPPNKGGVQCPPLCRLCTAQGVCTQCRANNGNGKSVYQAPNGQCRVCPGTNCRICTPQGTCDICRFGFRNDGGICKRVCKDVRCLRCPVAADKCTSCVATSGGYSIYLNLAGQCKACFKFKCTRCNQSGNCQRCEAGFELDGRGGCRRICPLTNCAVCPGNRQCAVCKPGFQFLSPTNRSQCIPICFVSNCARCIAGKAGKQCFACRAGFVLSRDKTTCTRSTVG